MALLAIAKEHVGAVFDLHGGKIAGIECRCAKSRDIHHIHFHGQNPRCRDMAFGTRDGRRKTFRAKDIRVRGLRRRCGVLDVGAVVTIATACCQCKGRGSHCEFCSTLIPLHL
ncbi:hypothetical protein D3C86_1563910 [compost metagenome]